MIVRKKVKFSRIAVLFCVLLVPVGGLQAASVSSIGRSIAVDEGKQRSVVCNDDTKRVISKVNGNRQWCLPGEGAKCFRDKLVAAKKACAIDLDVAVSAPKTEQSPVAKTGVVFSEKPRAKSGKSPKSETLKQELTEVETSIKDIKLKIERIDSLKESLLREREKS